MWGYLFGAAAGGATANPVLIVLSVYGLARAIHDLTTNKTSVDVVAATAKAAVDAIIREPQTPQVAHVMLDFDQARERYQQAHEIGLYAYLRENNIVHDWYHGQYLIKYVFLPEYERWCEENQYEAPMAGD